jgi:hypothetical protein
MAQFIEFGGGIGISNYTGDLNRVPIFSKSKPAVQAIYRMNFSEFISLKFTGTFAKLSGDDTKPIDALGVARDYSFDHNIIEFGTSFEYHFLNYRTQGAQHRWSPFISLGFAFTKISNVDPTFEEFNPIQTVIPMGGGAKFLLGKRFSLSVESGARKTFFDYLDGVSDGDIFIKDYQFGNPNDNDWYFYTGVSLTYIIYKIPCPFPYVPNKSIFNRIKAY